MPEHRSGHEAGPSDPLALTGVEVRARRRDVEAMARAFAEEFAACGWSAARLNELFRNPFYAGPHLALAQLGEARVEELIEEAVRPWRKHDA